MAATSKRKTIAQHCQECHDCDLAMRGLKMNGQRWLLPTLAVSAKTGNGQSCTGTIGEDVFDINQIAGKALQLTASTYGQTPKSINRRSHHLRDRTSVADRFVLGIDMLRFDDL
eukprot:4433914-Amphidinium_carterae.1